MPMMDDLLEEFSKDTDTTVTATETEQPKETETPKEEPKETKEAPAEQSEQVDTKPEQVSEPKPDLSQVSKEDKAAHAFRRQLSKQKEKHAQEIEDLKKSFQTQFDEFKASLKPKEEPKTRKDFATDDEYIKYLNKQGLEEVLAEQKAKQEEEAKAEAERKAEEEANDAMTRTFATNSHNVFKDPASYEAYANRVSKALDNGLGEVLDQVPAVRDFVFRNPEGPIVLDKILQSREAFVKVMTQTDPTMMIIACHELANERPAEPQSAPVAQETVHQMPHIGKPGAQKVSADAGSMFNSDKDLISYIRNVGSRRR